MNKRTVALLLALALVVGAAVGGTMAYLVDTTDAVKNTFTAGNVDIELSETDADKDGNANKNTYKMVPGATITKDPTVTVLANSEKCFVFVKLERSLNFGEFMTYTIAEDWISLTGVADVYYRVVEASGEDQTFGVLKDNAVSVKNTVTKDDMKGIETFGQPTMTITAYACQYTQNGTDAFNAEEAWNQVSGTNAE